jgi:malonyl-CoA O-methyltransferase
MTEHDPFALDRVQLRAAFERAASTYDTAANLQRDVADRLLQRLDDVRVSPSNVADIGCGTGYCTRALARRYKSARVIGLDIAHGMVQRARQRQRWHLLQKRARFVAGDAERLPFGKASTDIVFSSLALQWCEPRRALTEFGRVLRPGGLLMFTTFGPDTLIELRRAWAEVDTQPHVHGFLDMRDWGDQMLAAGFADPVVDVERVTLHYPDVIKVLCELKNIGAHNVAQDRQRGLTGKNRFERFRRAYEAMSTENGIPATYEIVFGHAWAPTMERSRRPDEAIIPLSSIRRRRG